MIRAPLGDEAYWNEWVSYAEERFKKVHLRLQKPSGEPMYRPQYVFELAQEYWEQMLRCYSRGDPIEGLVRYFPPMLDAWAESDRLYVEMGLAQELDKQRNWSTNLDHYIVCFWLIGFALAMNLADDQWRRLLVLIGNEGNDELLDRVIASRQKDRRIGGEVLHPAPYKQLLDAIDGPKDKQPHLLFKFVDRWYAELDRRGRKGVPAMYARPYWYTFGKNLAGGAYFGRWCVEAVAAVKAFGLDDSLCLGHPHYPGDLLRASGPTTHRSPPKSPAPKTSSNVAVQAKGSTGGLLGRLLRRD